MEKKKQWQWQNSFYPRTKLVAAVFIKDLFVHKNETVDCLIILLFHKLILSQSILSTQNSSHIRRQKNINQYNCIQSQKNPEPEVRISNALLILTGSCRSSRVIPA